MLDEVRTSQINCAAFLLTGGHNLLGLEPTGNGHRYCVFVFEAGRETQREMERYFSYRASVDARTYAQALAELKRVAMERLEQETRDG